MIDFIPRTNKEEEEDKKRKKKKVEEARSIYTKLWCFRLHHYITQW
jgi:hypothetical protein